MNDKTLEYVKNLGVMVETWVVVYGNFVKQGFSENDAINHTREFMKSVVVTFMNNKDEGKK